MKPPHDKRPKRVSEPVQVYLAPPEQARLKRLTAELSLSKSDVLRKGLEALEAQLTVPESHPALQVIGLVDDAEPLSDAIDVAREHDRYLARGEEASWNAGAGSSTALERARSTENREKSITETAGSDEGE